jgi:hypothetical protein
LWPYVYAGKTVTVREALEGGILRIFHLHDRIAEHQLVTGKGAMGMEAAHDGNLPRKNRASVTAGSEPVRELVPGPGVGLHYACRRSSCGH